MQSQSLRIYQHQAITQVQEMFKMGHKGVLLHLPTGSGKTVIMADIVKKAIAKGSEVLAIVRGVNLVGQISARLNREGLNHDIYQGNNTEVNQNKIAVASVDTLFARKIAPTARLLIIDEAHLTGGDAYNWLFAQYPNAYKLALTATPHTADGLGHLVSAVVRPIDAASLIQKGYLSRPIYFAPEKPELIEVPIKAGDYEKKSLEQVVMKQLNVGDPVKHYLKYGEKYPALMFAVSIPHSEALTARFKDAGIKCEHIDSGMNAEKIQDTIREFAAGHIDIISSVGLLTTGIDLPNVKCLIICRPTASYNLHMQILGRGTRLKPDGDHHFIVLDHAGNVMRHGFLESEKECVLNPEKLGRKKESSGQSAVPGLVTCLECYAIFSRFENPDCPCCGSEAPAPERSTEEKEGELKRLEVEKALMVRQYIDEKYDLAKKKRIKKRWIWHQVKDQFGHDTAEQFWGYVKQKPAYDGSAAGFTPPWRAR